MALTSLKNIFLKILHFVLRSQMLISTARNKEVVGEPEEISNFCKTKFFPTSLFYKKVVYKKVALDWLKPQESYSTSSKKLKKIFKLNQTVHNCIVSPLVI